MFSKILVAVDGSPTSKKALQVAAKLAGEKTEFRIVTAVENPAHLLGVNDEAVYPSIDKLRQAGLEQGGEVLKSAQQQLESHHVRADYQLLDQTQSINSTIAEGILMEAAQWNADLIVIGTHGRKGLRRWLLGSVAEQVIRSSPRPVLSVRQPDPSRTEKEFAEWPAEELMGS